MNDWITEETYFELRRKYSNLKVLDTKWSGGSSPIMLYKVSY